MSRRIVVVAVVSLAFAAPAIRTGAQSGASPPAATAPIRQAAYLKASNAAAADHFGCGGVLQGHTGQGVAISADGSTLAVGAPHEGSAAGGVDGNQNDDS